jgi:AAA+ ATPase superfamily predicted ATPase
MEKIAFSLTPVAGKYFVGRKSLIDELVKELEQKNSHIGFCIYGRRRVGKTSVLMETKTILSKKKELIVAYLSLYDIVELSPQIFAEELVSSVITAYQEKGLLPLKMQVKELLKTPIGVVTEFLKGIKVEARVIEQLRLIFEHKEGDKNYPDYLKEAFNLGEVLAETTSTKCVIMLDEFPEIVLFENGLQLVKMLRTQYEKQKRTAIVVSGSIRHTLEIVALSESSPFYKQLVPKHLLPFTKQEVGEFLELYIGKASDDEITRLHTLTGGLPFYLQYIGRSTRYIGKIDEIIDTFIKQEGDVFFREEFEKLGGKEKDIVISLSDGKKSLTEIAKENKEPATNISPYLPSLIENEFVVKEERGSYTLSDPLFGYWIKNKTIK